MVGKGLEAGLPNLYAHLLNAILTTVLLIEVMRRVAPGFRLVDLPDLRKQHEGAVPLCGGLAIFGAFLITALGFDGHHEVPWYMAAGIGILVLTGAADDRWGLRAATRLVIQLCAALSLILPGMSLSIHLGYVGELPVLLSPLLGGALALVFLVGSVNAINMLDGIDGLAGASVAAALFWLALIAAHVGDTDVVLQALVLLAATIGFLVFNMRHPWRSKASVFLGDAGSAMLGAFLAYFVVRLSTGSSVAFVSALWILVIPFMDTLSLIMRRIAARRSPFSPDRMHLHHLLVDRGMPHAQAAVLIAGVSALCGAIGYFGILFGVPDILMALGLAIPVAAHVAAVTALTGAGRSSNVQPAGNAGFVRRDTPPVMGGGQ